MIKISESIVELVYSLLKSPNKYNNKDKIEDTYEKITRLVSDRQDFFAKSFEQLVYCYEQALKIEPNNLDFLKEISYIFCERKDYRKALPYLKKIVHLEPEVAFHWNILANCYFHANKYIHAKINFKKALALDDRDAEIHSNCGMLYKKMRYFDTAIFHLKIATELDPKDDFKWLMLGHAYQNHGMGIEAIEFYMKAEEINPRNDTAWNNLGLIYAQHEDFEEAVKYYKRAIQYNANSAITWHNLRFAYYGTEEYEKADYCEKRATQLYQDPYHQEEDSRKKSLWYFS